MSAYDTLPVILVSAAGDGAAKALISEIIDNKATDIKNEDNGPLNCVWRIVNKYYTADVRLHQLIDGDHLQVDPECVEAHIVYLAENECTIEVAEKRMNEAGVASDNSSVRIVAAEAKDLSSDFITWAVMHHLDLVPLKEKPPPLDDDNGDEPFPEVYGVERVRAALQAHPWSGLVRTDQRPRELFKFHCSPPDPHLSESSSDGEGLEDEDDELGDSDVERAEAFAAALGTLNGAAQHTAGAGDAGRLDRAEEIVAAFCRALGYDLDNC